MSYTDQSNLYILYFTRHQFGSSCGPQGNGLAGGSVEVDSKQMSSREVGALALLSPEGSLVRHLSTSMLIGGV